MPVQYVNKKGRTYYLHQDATKTGKPRYFFSMNNQGIVVDAILNSFEIYENPNAQVFLRRIQPKIITDNEIAIVEEGMKQFSQLQYYQIDVKKNTISVFVPDQDVKSLSEILSSSPRSGNGGVQDLLSRFISYSPMFQFILIDEGKRVFVAQRYCFSGSIDNWINIAKPDTLQTLVKTYLRHLGQDFYFELF